MLLQHPAIIRWRENGFVDLGHPGAEVFSEDIDMDRFSDVALVFTEELDIVKIFPVPSTS
jgi:hypothetical protein